MLEAKDAPGTKEEDPSEDEDRGQDGLCASVLLSLANSIEGPYRGLRKDSEGVGETLNNFVARGLSSPPDRMAIEVLDSGAG